jgi:hypothetical protein
LNSQATVADLGRPIIDGFIAGQHGRPSTGSPALPETMRGHPLFDPLTDHYFFGVDAASRRTRAIHNAFRRIGGLQSHIEHRRCFYLTTILQRAG